METFGKKEIHNIEGILADIKPLSNWTDPLFFAELTVNSDGATISVPYFISISKGIYDSIIGKAIRFEQSESGFLIGKTVTQKFQVLDADLPNINYEREMPKSYYRKLLGKYYS